MADTPFNIDTFNAEMSKSGIAATSFFMASITKSPPTVSRKFNLTDGMAFRIESVNLPGRTLTTLDQNYHGPVRRIPYRFTHQPATFTVILSRDMREREFFMAWQDVFLGNYRATATTAAPNRPFETRYYDDGVGEIRIVQLSYPITQTGSGVSKAYERSYSIELLEAYPSSVQDIQLGWGEEGYGKLQVEITYRVAQEKHLLGDTRSLAAQKSTEEAIRATGQ